jgi:uncharacterized protein (TIGR00661 family)
VVAKGLNKICFYTSDYGYGHAARDIALIKRITKEGLAEVTVKTEKAFDFMRQSLPGCDVIRQCNDMGPVYKNDSIMIDCDLTEKALEGWISSWDRYIRAEMSFCREKGIDLIISDIAPQPFLVAEGLGVPGIGFSNFTWHYIFSNLLGTRPATERLKEAYEAGDMAMVLPFHEEMRLFQARKEISLVSRDFTVRRDAMRAKLGLSGGEILIHMGAGMSLHTGIFRRLKDIDLNHKKLLLSSDVELPGGLPPEKLLRIPSTETESQNYLAASDMIVSKAGYSTVSEAIRGRVPMFLFRREGYEEDSLIVRAVEELGIGREIGLDDFAEGEWIEGVDDLDIYRAGFDSLSDTLRSDGTVEAIAAIKEIIS